MAQWCPWWWGGYCGRCCAASYWRCARGSEMGDVDTRLGFGVRQWWSAEAQGRTAAQQRRSLLNRCDTRGRRTRAVGVVADIVANSERRVERGTIMVYIKERVELRYARLKARAWRQCSRTWGSRWWATGLASTGMTGGPGRETGT